MKTFKRIGYKIVIDKECIDRINKNLCPICSKPKINWNRRKDWTCCSKECTTEYLKKHYSFGWASFKMKAFQRDNATCQKCGIQVPSKKEEGHVGDDNWIRDLFGKWFVIKRFYYSDYFGKKQLCAEVYDTSQLIADHIKPIAIGGNEWDLNNIQTLCKKCNKEKTKKDMIDIAIFRKMPESQKNLI